MLGYAKNIPLQYGFEPIDLFCVRIFYWNFSD